MQDFVHQQYDKEARGTALRSIRNFHCTAQGQDQKAVLQAVHDAPCLSSRQIGSYVAPAGLGGPLLAQAAAFSVVSRSAEL